MFAVASKAKQKKDLPDTVMKSYQCFCLLTLGGEGGGGGNKYNTKDKFKKCVKFWKGMLVSRSENDQKRKKGQGDTKNRYADNDNRRNGTYQL